MTKFWSFSVEPVNVDPGGDPGGEDSLLDGPSKLFKLVADWNPDSWLCWSFFDADFSGKLKKVKLRKTG